MRRARVYSRVDSPLADGSRSAAGVGGWYSGMLPRDDKPGNASTDFTALKCRRVFCELRRCLRPWRSVEDTVSGNTGSGTQHDFSDISRKESRKFLLQTGATEVLTYEKELKSDKQVSSRPEFPTGACAAISFERDELGNVFWGLKEEFHRIRTLARTQTDQLSKFKLRREPVTEISFSKPIQCTDEHADDLCNPWVKKDLNRDLVPQFPSITPRGIGPDEEENSVESLSKLNVKFPPTDSDSTFLQSTPDTLPVPCAVGPECLLPDPQFDRELGDPAVNFSEATCHLFEERAAVPFTAAGHNLLAVNKIKPPTHTNELLQSPLDKALGFTAPFLNNFEAFSSLEANEGTVGAPQQPLWKPYHAEDNDLSTVASADPELDQPGVCEFCQKVFPPSLTSSEDFLRHLNSHFDKKT
uniref:Uncharacterized protein n=1 Tax=Sphaerodactylus townsendi TaxID=933632 RepID=A0ACB8G176_9SAUR